MRYKKDFVSRELQGDLFESMDEFDGEDEEDNENIQFIASSRFPLYIVTSFDQIVHPTTHDRPTGLIRCFTTYYVQ